MSALFPRNYGSFSHEIYFNPFKQNRNHYNDRKSFGQQPFFPSFHQTSFLPTGGYLPTGFNQYGRSGANTTSLMRSSGLDDQHQNTWPYMNKIQRRYWNQQDTGIPLPRYTQPYPVNYDEDTIYQYEREVRYVPYPVFVGPGFVRPGFAGRGTTGTLGYGNTLGSGYPGRFNTTVPNFGNVSSLPPKIRVIFIPPGSSPFQQSFGSPLTMPPFLFNRMAQPLCSFPLPPPLPQIGSLPITPAIQQMIMQQYANPVAVLPFNSNWQIPQSIMPTYPPAFQQQSMMLPSPWQSYQSALQPYPSNWQSSQSASPPYIPPAIMPSNMSMMPSDVSSSLPFSNPLSSMPQYPSTCRACVPAPPSLTVPVTGHCWIQHCSACHHIPADTTNPNVRPSNGRITPLLRHPTVAQNVQNQRTQQEQYPHINASAAMHPSLHQMPPLPPGAVIISDEYITKNDLAAAHHYSQNNSIQHPRVSHSLPRPAATRTYSTDKSRRNESVSRRKQYKNLKNYTKSELKSKPNNTKPVLSVPTPPKGRPSTSSECSTCDLSTVTEDKKPNTNPPNNQKNPAHMQLPALIRKLELRYNHQIPDIQAVYHINNDLKSSDEDSVSLTNSTVSSNLPIIKESDQNNVSLSIDINSLKEEDKKSVHILSPTPVQSEQPKRRLIIIRQFRTDSPSTISTVSSNLSFNSTSNDSDAISTTSTIKPDKTDEKKAIIGETH